MTVDGRVGVTTVTTPTDTQVVIERVVAAPKGIVFDAYTNPKHLQKWLLGPEGWTMPICEMDLRPGGKWRYVWRKADGIEMQMGGLVKEVVPGEKIVTTERWGPDWPETINSVTLTESGGFTTIALTITYPSREARDAALKTGMTEGMNPSFARLDRLLRELV